MFRFRDKGHQLAAPAVRVRSRCRNADDSRPRRPHPRVTAQNPGSGTTGELRAGPDATSQPSSVPGTALDGDVGMSEASPAKVPPGEGWSLAAPDRRPVLWEMPACPLLRPRTIHPATVKAGARCLGPAYPSPSVILQGADN